MVSKKEPEQKQGGAKRILAAIAIIATALFLLAAAAPAAAPESSMQPAATAVSNYTPAPTLNTNITWRAFNSSWQEFEYSNGTGTQILNATPSTFYANPISINPADITSSDLTGQYAGVNFYSTAYRAQGSSPQPKSISNTSTSLSISGAANSTAAFYYWSELPIAWADLPSLHANDVYLTATLTVAPNTDDTTSATLTIGNSTSSGSLVTNTYPDPITQGMSEYISEPLSTLAKGMQYNYTSSPYIYIGLDLTQQAASSTPTATATLSNLAITTYPVALGENGNGTVITNGTGIIHLSKFNPTVPMTVQNNGYSVAASSIMQNTTEQQTSINDGSFTEQATYQGILTLPTAPDLSYSTSNITLPLTVSGSQYEVANLNGVSYLTSLQSKTNGTFSFGTVNANAQNSIILEVKYTTAQWDTSSSAPSFFTLAGIEYYWWVTVLGLMGLIGLGSLAISHFGGEEETLRVPKGKFGR